MMLIARRRVRQFLGFSWLAAAVGVGPMSVAAEQGPRIAIDSAADRTVVRIGDAITYSVTVRYDSSLVLAAADPGQALGAFEIRDRVSEPVEAEPGWLAVTERFTLAGYAPGSHHIGPRSYLIQSAPRPEGTQGTIDTLMTAAIQVHVISTLPPDAQDVRDIKSPLDISRELPIGWILLVAGATVAAVVAAVWFILRRRRRPAVIEMPPPRPAHEVAYEALEELKRLNLPASGRMKAYYISLSETLRRYMSARFAVPAMDRTTTELLQLMRQMDCGAEPVSAVRGVLDESDRVKFARWAGTLEDAATSLERVYWVVDHTRYEGERILPTAALGGGGA